MPAAASAAPITEFTAGLNPGSMPSAIVAASDGTTGAHCKWLPKLISSANGTKNLNDALNHSQ